MKKNTLPAIAAFLLVILFSYTSISKILEQGKFVFQMRLSPWPLLRQGAGLVGWSLPLIEALITLLLLFPRTRRIGFWSSMILLIVFETYIAVLMLSGVQLPCTCGGLISHMTWAQHLWFNGFFILLTCLAIWKWEYYPTDNESSNSFSRV